MKVIVSNETFWKNCARSEEDHNNIQVGVQAGVLLRGRYVSPQAASGGKDLLPEERLWLLWVGQPFCSIRSVAESRREVRVGRIAPLSRRHSYSVLKRDTHGEHYVGWDKILHKLEKGVQGVKQSRLLGYKKLMKNIEGFLWSIALHLSAS